MQGLKIYLVLDLIFITEIRHRNSLLVHKVSESDTRFTKCAAYETKSMPATKLNFIPIKIIMYK